MIAVRTASTCDAPLDPPAAVDGPVANLAPCVYDALAGDFLRSLHGGPIVEKFEDFVQTRRAA